MAPWVQSEGSIEVMIIVNLQPPSENKVVVQRVSTARQIHDGQVMCPGITTSGLALYAPANELFPNPRMSDAKANTSSPPSQDACGFGGSELEDASQRVFAPPDAARHPHVPAPRGRAEILWRSAVSRSPLFKRMPCLRRRPREGIPIISVSRAKRDTH